MKLAVAVAITSAHIITGFVLLACQARKARREFDKKMEEASERYQQNTPPNRGWN